MSKNEQAKNLVVDLSNATEHPGVKAVQPREYVFGDEAWLLPDPISEEFEDILRRFRFLSVARIAPIQGSYSLGAKYYSSPVKSDHFIVKFISRGEKLNKLPMLEFLGQAAFCPSKERYRFIFGLDGNPYDHLRLLACIGKLMHQRWHQFPVDDTHGIEGLINDAWTFVEPIYDEIIEREQQCDDRGRSGDKRKGLFGWFGHG